MFHLVCGIIGFCTLSKTPLAQSPGSVLFKGLKRLEYRGYDSAGVAGVYQGKLIVLKGKGKLDELEEKIRLSSVRGYTVIGHTRWATHGIPNDVNAHPQTDCRNEIAVVHNGIIQNYRELRQFLVERGHVFESDTDTEVIPHLVEEFYREFNDLYTAFKQAIKMLKGSYAIAMVSTIEPDKIFFARKDSPLVIGLGNGYNFVASDIPAFLEYTNRVIIVYDDEIGYITSTNVFLENIGSGVVDWSKRVRVVEWSIEDASKSGYPHYMLKEIMEQPRALRDTLYGLLSDVVVDEAVSILLNSRKVFITAAGTSFHASLYYSLLSSILLGKPVIPFIASEYMVYSPIASSGDTLIVVSQSGETIDSLMALRAFKKKGVRVIAVSNVVDSAIPRESDVALYTRAGPEIGVAATKTFTTQVLLLTFLALKQGSSIGRFSESEYREYIGLLKKVPEFSREVLASTEDIVKELAKWLSRKKSIYYLSRGIGLPIAMEGALKLKEIAYIHAESYPAGESKHGPIALVEKDFPVLFVIPPIDYLEELLLGNIQEMKARGATIICVLSEKSNLIDQCHYPIKTPHTHWLLTPFTHTIPLQLLAYYTAVVKGLDPDKPRNLAKTVTVE